MKLLDSPLIEVKGNFVYVDGKPLRNITHAFSDLKKAYPIAVDVEELSFAETLLLEVDDYLYKIITVPSKRVSIYLNKFPAYSYKKEAYFQLLWGKALIQYFCENKSFRLFAKIESMKPNVVYVIKPYCGLSITNIGIERLILLSKEPKERFEVEEPYYITIHGYEQNASLPVFGEAMLSFSKSSLLEELKELLNK